MQKTFLLILIAAFGLVAWQTGKRIETNVELSSEIKSLGAEIGRLKGGNIGLLEMLQYAKSDAYLEREGRIRFGLGKPGEKVVVLPPAGEQGNKKQQEQKGEQRMKNPERWWTYFTAGT
jgi:cell division protein FtsB